MPAASNRTVICSVVFLDIVAYSEKPVSEQSQLKERLNEFLAEALSDVAPNDRVILDTGDGAALSFLGDPEDALFASLSLRDAIGLPQMEEPELQVRIGINLGPVRLVKDLNGQLNIIGDGINVAQRVMSFAAPGQILVSRSYYEVVSRLSKDYEQLFHYEGARTDKHVREHEVYAIAAAISPPPRPFPPAGRHASESRAEQGGLVPLSPGARLIMKALRHKAWLGGAVVAVAIVVSAVGLRVGRESAEAPHVESKPAPARPKPLTQPQAPGPAVSPGKEARATTAVGQPAGPAVVTFAITPWGEIYIDGQRRGVAPPLRDVELKPGKHKIEVRNGAFPPYVESVDVAPSGRARIKHTFR